MLLSLKTDGDTESSADVLFAPMNVKQKKHIDKVVVKAEHVPALSCFFFTFAYKTWIFLCT